MTAWISTEGIIQVSLIGLGLLLALYTIISNRLDDLQSSRTLKYLSLKEKEEDIFKKLSRDKRNISLRRESNEINEEIQQIISGNKYHYDWGYIVSGALFMASIILSLISVSFLFTGQFSDKSIKIISSYSLWALFFGIINFFYIWLRTMLDMRTLFKQKMELVTEFKKEQDKKTNGS